MPRRANRNRILMDIDYGDANKTIDVTQKWECVYCGSLHPDSLFSCDKCGAGRRGASKTFTVNYTRSRGLTAVRQ